MSKVIDNYTAVKADVSAACAAASRDVDQVQLLPRQIVIRRRILDDLVDLGHRPCEVILGLLGQRRKRFIHLVDLVVGGVIPLHLAANLFCC